MRILAFILGFLASFALCNASETLYFNDCEQIAGNQISGLSRCCPPCGKQPYSGKTCAVMVNNGEVTGGGGTDPWLSVEPSQWYRLTVMSRNDMPTGVIRIGLTTSTTTSSRQVIWHGRYHKVIPCNSNEWRAYSLDLKTTPETRGMTFILRVDGSPEKQGAAYFDDIRIEKISAPVNHLILAPYEALVSFVDQPTMLARRPDAKKTGSVWREVDLAATPARVVYDQLPLGSVIACRVSRGQDIVFSAAQTVSGTGEASFAIPVHTFAKGIYELDITASSQGKKISGLSRTIRRITAASIRPPEFEAVKTSGQVPGTQFLGINGKYHPFVWFCAFPDRNSPCALSMDGIEEYLRISRAQTGTNIIGVSCKGSRPMWPGNPKGMKSEQEVADFYVKFFREQMDTCAKLGYHATVWLHLGPGFKTDDNLARLVARGVKSHPALISFNYDEPECRKETPERMKEQYKVLKAEDPDHFVDINLCQPWNFKKYYGCSDTAAFDYYPFHGTDLLEWEVFYLKMKEAMPDKPYISWYQYFNFEGERMPSAQELTAQQRLSVILGQRVMSVYSWSDGMPCESAVNNMESQSLLKGLIAEFFELMAFIVPGRQVAVPFEVDARLRAAAYRNGDEMCIVVVNPSSISERTITLPKDRPATAFLDSAWRYPGGHVFTLPPNGSLLLRQPAK